MVKDAKSKTDANDFYRFHYWREKILGFIGLVCAFLILVFRAIWDNTLVMILVLWGFVAVLALAWLVMRAVQRRQEKKRGSRSDPATDEWRMPPTDRK